MSNRSANVRSLLKSNVRWLNATPRKTRPPSGVSQRTRAVIEYYVTSSLLDKYGSSSSTGLAGTACALARVTDGEGREQARYPHVLRQALLGAASARTAEKMAKEFFGTLKRVGGVSLVRVDAPAPKRRPVPKAAPAPVHTAAPEPETEVDPMAALRAEMAAQDDWDAETDEERLARESAEIAAATKMAAVWRGYVCRQNEKDMKLLCAVAEKYASPEEEDDAAQLAELGQPEPVPEPDGMTEEDLLRQSTAEADRAWEEDREWEEYEAEQRMEEDREWEGYEAEQRMEEDLAVLRGGDGAW